MTGAAVTTSISVGAARRDRDNAGNTFPETVAVAATTTTPGGSDSFALRRRSIGRADKRKTRVSRAFRIVFFYERFALAGYVFHPLDSSSPRGVSMTVGRVHADERDNRSSPLNARSHDVSDVTTTGVYRARAENKTRVFIDYARKNARRRTVTSRTNASAAHDDAAFRMKFRLDAD